MGTQAGTDDTAPHDGDTTAYRAGFARPARRPHPRQATPTSIMGDPLTRRDGVIWLVQVQFPRM